ncbi:hypothetical protein Y1Q_0010194 [Alligator mississippiensis]|uniref:Uncharacterized protein n=1 Tax=Alligator mississippiensis TaxID=8496 RepID=A0A151NGI6_ALLMI|nr:hypothetical protein Y1Q_0010194 [Alligator mississippiensis]
MRSFFISKARPGDKTLLVPELWGCSKQEWRKQSELTGAANGSLHAVGWEQEEEGEEEEEPGTRFCSGKHGCSHYSMDKQENKASALRN